MTFEEVPSSQGDATGGEPPRAARGLSAAELALVIAELEAELLGASVVDVARRSDDDDLLVFLAAAAGKRALHVVPAGSRARVTTTTRRFPKEMLATGPRVDALRQQLVDTRLLDIEQPGGERCCRFRFRGAGGDVVLVAELFGARGLWCLLDDAGRITEMSRLPHSAQRDLAPGAAYAPPAPHRAAASPPSRFAAPVCAAVDRWFTALDLEAERSGAREGLTIALARAQKRCRDRLAGLERQDAEATRAPELRRTADLLLAYAHTVRRGDVEMVVPDPEHQGAQVRIPLDPAQTAPAQAKALYTRARKLEQAAAFAAQRRSDAEHALAELDALAARLDSDPDEAELAVLEAELARRGALPKPQGPPAPPPPQVKKITKGENFRRFTSLEGHLIMAGRTNQQNDKLTLRVARGNDVWLHVGQGYAGSHVVVRLPREKTASLETLLDAATLAIHFSKARGNPRCDVIYTFCKHVRKPKGAPAGSVVATHTKTLTVRHEASRLARLLESSEA